jgi:glycosyltransferase involved in cell wall biosynthesis
VDELVLIVPCFNEAERIDVAAFSAFAKAEPSVRLLFVDDGSRDDTAARCATLGEVIRLPTNVGKGEAVRAGVLAALDGGAAVVGWWDADLATPLDEVARLRAALRGDVAFVLGSRVKLLGRTIDRSLVRHYLGRVAATGVSLTLGLRIYDSQCGAKLMRASLAAELFNPPFLTPWMFEVELLARLRHRRPGWTSSDVERVVHEVPLHRWREVPGSRLRWTDVVAVPWQLWRIWRAWPRR